MLDSAVRVKERKQAPEEVTLGLNSEGWAEENKERKGWQRWMCKCLAVGRMEKKSEQVGHRGTKLLAVVW